MRRSAQSNARAFGVFGAGHSMSMMTNTLGRYFAGRFVVVGARRVRQHLRAAGAGRLHRDGQEDVGAGDGIRHHGRGDVAVPGAATARKDDAVLHPDRSDDLLPRAFAAAGTGGRARGRRFGLAVHRAGAGQRDRARDPGDDRLQSDVRQSARTLQTDGGGAVRLRSAAAAYRMRPVSGSIRSTAMARPSSTPPAASSRACG